MRRWLCRRLPSRTAQTPGLAVPGGPGGDDRRCHRAQDGQAFLPWFDGYRSWFWTSRSLSKVSFFPRISIVSNKGGVAVFPVTAILTVINSRVGDQSFSTNDLPVSSNRLALKSSDFIFPSPPVKA